MKKGYQHITGIGLLELLLVLSVTAVMLIVSVQYYRSAKSGQESATLVNSFNTIKSAVENYITDNPTATFPTLTTLYTGGYLPNAYQNGRNTWLGTIVVAAGQGTKAGLFSVTQTKIPASVCGEAQPQLLATLNSALGESIIPATATGCKGDNNTVIVYYSQ